MNDQKIIYTITDEAPALATQSLLPIVKSFLTSAKIPVETRDISLSGRILAAFSDCLPKDKQQSDDLKELGEIAKSPSANIIKLPNISASVPQLMAAIKELQDQGYNIPDYPAEPKNDEEVKIKARYGTVLGSAVNPVLREGNSDRRVAKPVKEFAKKNPHSMGEWSNESKSHVACMSEGDFFGSEKSCIIDKNSTLKIEFTSESGKAQILKDSVKVSAEEIVDVAVMSASHLRRFLKQEIADAKEQRVLFSVHLKATMMKISDPVLFGHAVSCFFEKTFTKHAKTFESIGVDANNGLGDLYRRLDSLDHTQKQSIINDLNEEMATRPDLAMVDSDKGITNLHVPSDVIIDASMPAMIRSSGKMWGRDGKLHDCKAVIPDRSYARIYQEVINFCKKHGAFDPRTMGNVANVGLMAQKAEEYGSHDKTFIIPEKGVVRVTGADNKVLFETQVEAGDIWRMCQTKDIAIRDWVRLAVERAKATKCPAVFWLDEQRAHDATLIKKVEKYLKDFDTAGLEIKIMSTVEAMRYSLERVKEGLDTISVTGNVLRDYLTDLFPILELGTSAKMLSIVPLLAGGGLYETGAGGSAPKHVQQFVEEGHLRWDSLGEFLALSVSLEDLGQKHKDPKVAVLAETLSTAIGQILDHDRSPSRKVGELDNRGTHYYLALYWSEALAKQSKDVQLQKHFAKFAQDLAQNEAKILAEIANTEGQPVDLKGYYHPDAERLSQVMRPSFTFNGILETLAR